MACDIVAKYFDGAVAHSADPNNLSDGDAERLFNAGVFGENFSDVTAFGTEVVENGCELVDTVSLSQSASVSGDSITTTATVNIPGSSSVELTVVATLDDGNQQTATETVTDGDTISVSYDNVSPGDHTVCIDIQSMTV